MKHRPRNSPSNGDTSDTGRSALWRTASHGARGLMRAIGLALPGGCGRTRPDPRVHGHRRASGGFQPVRLIRALLAAAVLLAGGPPLAGAGATSPGQVATQPDAAPQHQKLRSVLILSGVQPGLPVPDAMVANAVAALKNKGISVNNIYAEHLDIARHGDPASRSALAAMLRQKLSGVDIGLVIVPNIASPAVMDFLAREGHDILPADTPVMTILPEKSNSTWARERPHLMNVPARPDVAGTLRHGLDLFPRTRHLLVVTDTGSGRNRPWPRPRRPSRAWGGISTSNTPPR